ncbi:MAG: chromosome partitioning protein ParB [Anaerophaga sp.]|uniref:ParB/RepB/Spo0J family partition protein n=1 Tax=Anaerophaga thermohalophila TaxID=177400 RepID=UPI000237C484|nr:ParB/RepB/Spo0J family partition protein [Anaerophaga thermohalophila]MBZ4675542.1 chromosome partitioning protein ParB [Anaerophaga sp.]MDK2841424.1 ParB family transcriptional regulator, chromosome partitioning protein [Anaerophaga sp.]MDN5291441.1 ParB family transcriptional regulator, chromosome partitioning protein [Anaerophaga sp.]
MARKNALGRGLGALIDNAEEYSQGAPKAEASINEIPIDKIEGNPWQPRSRFDEESLNELAASIREIGIIQPLTLRKAGNKFQLIAGERRFRAAKIAGLETVPAYVRMAEDETMLEMALVENIQREDLDPIEVAISYQRLIDECNLTQESMSERVGKKRSTIANYLRLLKLPAEIQLGLREKQISMGHARALINLEDQKARLKIFNQIVKNDLSVRKVEELVRKANQTEETKKKETKKDELPEEYEQLKQQLSNFFKTNIQFSRGNDGKGKIVIPFRSDDELEKIVNVLDKAKTK